MSDFTFLERALRDKFLNLTYARGEIIMPCIPGMLAEHMNRVEGVLRSLGVDLTPAESNSLREAIAQKLAQGFQASPFSRLIFKYEPPDLTSGLSKGLKIQTKIADSASLEQKYSRWLKTRSGSLFGTHPDAKVMAVAAQLGDAKMVKILDVGAGTGRNTFALAERGHPVEAIELTDVFVRQLSDRARSHNLPVTITQGDILAASLQLSSDHYQLAIASEVISHFRQVNQVRTLLVKMCDRIQPGGMLLFNIFLTDEDYQPDRQVRELAQVVWSYFLTRAEFRSVLQGLPLKILSIEPMLAYEQNHLPPEAWPPTNWFISWASGRNIFPIVKQPPVQLYWILAQRHGNN